MALCCGRSQERAEADGVTVGPRALALNTLSFYHHQSSTHAFDFDNKTLVGFRLCLKLCLSVKYWMVLYERFIRLYDTLTNPWQAQGWDRHNLLQTAAGAVRSSE